MHPVVFNGVLYHCCKLQRLGLVTENRNLCSFPCFHLVSRYLFRPRLLSDVSHRRLSTTVLGHPIDFPIGIAPTGLQGFAHTDGEIATARGGYIPLFMHIISEEELGWA